MDEQVIWRPGKREIETSVLGRFAREVALEVGDKTLAADPEALYRWSVDNPERFWNDIWRFFDVIGDRGDGPACVAGETMRDTRWFPSARLNFAENLLRVRDESVALVARSEDGRRREMTYRELAREVAEVAGGLRHLGVRPGDRVAALLPNTIETVVGMLATASIGAIWSTCSPDFGARGVLDRFGQIDPSVLIVTDAVRIQGRRLSQVEKVAQVRRELRDDLVVVWVGFLDDAQVPDGELSYEDFKVAGLEEPAFEPCGFNDPQFILYSSGTTGKPKCIVHGVGGTLLQHLKELALHTDVRRGDTVFYFTTCGWMMWNWLVSSLALGARLILYDGSPLHPHPTSMLTMAEEEDIKVFGINPKFVLSLKKLGVNATHTHELRAMEAVLSTGSVLPAEAFHFIQSHIKPGVRISSISGGTDIVSCFVLGSPMRPVIAGQIQCRGLGLSVEVYDDEGRPVVGEKGELVCTAPFPAMPVAFWNDPDGERYQAAYFDRFGDVWAHGDYAELTPAGGMILYGRSDAVLNPGGVRIGTAELYREVEKVEEVVDCLAIDQEWNDDVRVVLFICLAPGVEMGNGIRRRIREIVRYNTTPHHVPSVIIDVPMIPRTVSGKITELAVRNIIHNRPVTNIEALVNPEALEYFRDRVELR